MGVRLVGCNAVTTNLRDARLANGWSQTRLVYELQRRARAHASAVPTRDSLKTQVSRWENGHKVPDETYRRFFREIYGLSDHELGFPRSRTGQRMSMARPGPMADLATPELIGHLRALISDFTRIDCLIGPRDLLTAVRDQAAFVEQVCLVATGPMRIELLGVASHFAEFSGWLSQDAGDYKAAISWTDRAMDYAQELGDLRRISYVLMRKSNIATDALRPAPGLGLADAALRANRQLTPRLRAVALRQRANAYAMTGDRQACMRALTEAADQVAAAGTETDLAPYCTPAYIEMEAANCWLQLQEPAKAVPIFEQGLATWPAGQERDRGLCLSRLATAHALAGDLEAACCVGQAALTVLRKAHSARILDQLRRLRRQLVPSRTVHAVADLDQAFSEFVRSSPV